MTPMRSAEGPLLQTIKITLIDVDRLLEPALEEGLWKTNNSHSVVYSTTRHLWLVCCCSGLVVAAHASFLWLVVCLFNCMHPLSLLSFLIGN